MLENFELQQVPFSRINFPTKYSFPPLVCNYTVNPTKGRSKIEKSHERMTKIKLYVREEQYHSNYYTAFDLFIILVCFSSTSCQAFSLWPSITIYITISLWDLQRARSLYVLGIQRQTLSSLHSDIVDSEKDPHYILAVGQTHTTTLSYQEVTVQCSVAFLFSALLLVQK